MEKAELLYNNSSTTCDLTDEHEDGDNSILEGRGWDIPDNKCIQESSRRPSEAIRSNISSPRQVNRTKHVRSKTSASPLPPKAAKKLQPKYHRARLNSSDNASTSSCNSTDSLHRRGSADLLPSLDKILGQPALAPAGALGKPFNVPPPPLTTVHTRRPSMVHARGLSTGSQLTQSSGLTQLTSEYDESYTEHEDSETESTEADEEESAGELCFDLSVSENAEDEGSCDSNDATKKSTPPWSPVEEFETPSPPTKHVRHLSHCSSTSESSNSPNCVSQATEVFEQGVSKATTSDQLVVPDISKTVQSPHRSEGLHVQWAGLDPNDKRTLGVKAASFRNATVNDEEVQYNPASYLPSLPIPDAAAASLVASVFTAGWTAVFWKSPTGPGHSSNDVPNVTLDKLYFIQLLSGGMLQLTPAVEGATHKTILVMPKCRTVQGGGGEWKVQLVSRRAGHCLAVDITASTGSSKQQREIYILPVHLPHSYRSRMPKPACESEQSVGEMLFTPFRASDTQEGPLFAPSHQHDAVLHLRFAMEAAMSMDLSRQRQRKPRHKKSIWG